MEEEEESSSAGDLTQFQLAISSAANRAASVVSLGCALIMTRLAYRRSDRLYHRLILGMSLHLISYMVWNVVENWAVPVGTPHAYDPRGTTRTCSAQGFFFQLAFCIPFYYVFLSTYSFVAIRNRFDPKKYMWVEPYIHILVHVFPVGSAIYLLTLEAYNYNGYAACNLASIPFGCGDDSPDGIPCERGPQNMEQLAWYFNALPGFFVLTFPTLSMALLYGYVRRNQKAQSEPQQGLSSTVVVLQQQQQQQQQQLPEIPIDATVFAKQAVVYLLVLYWSYIFGMVNKGIAYIGDTLIFELVLVGEVNFSLQGLWLLLVYLYFSVDPTNSNDGTRCCCHCCPGMCSNCCRNRIRNQRKHVISGANNNSQLDASVNRRSENASSTNPNDNNNNDNDNNSMGLGKP